MKLYIKNMVCHRCIIVVSDALKVLDIAPQYVTLGEVDFGDRVLSDHELTGIRQKIEPLGFEVIGDKRSRLIESIKQQIIALVQQQDGLLQVKLSDFLSKQIAYEYNYLSSLFSSIEGMTIERYFILQKIEKVKELLVYDELSLTEISFQLGYSSLAHLSNQFKAITGLSPSHFRGLKNTKLRNSIDNL